MEVRGDGSCGSSFDDIIISGAEKTASSLRNAILDLYPPSSSDNQIFSSYHSLFCFRYLLFATGFWHLEVSESPKSLALCACSHKPSESQLVSDPNTNSARNFR